MRKELTGIAAAVVLMAGVSQAEAASIFTDRAAWEAAVAGFTTETFDTSMASANVLVLNSDITSTTDVVTKPNGLNEVGFGAYRGRLGGSGSHPNNITWDFGSSVVGFFADFGSLNSNGLTVTGDFDGTGDQTFSIATTVGGVSGGFGLLGTATFSTFDWGSNDPSEFFTVDNFSYSSVLAPGGEQQVPEPGSLATFGASLAALGWLRRRRRQGHTLDS